MSHNKHLLSELLCFHKNIMTSEKNDIEKKAKNKILYKHNPYYSIYNYKRKIKRAQNCL